MKSKVAAEQQRRKLPAGMFMGNLAIGFAEEFSSHLLFSSTVTRQTAALPALEEME